MTPVPARVQKALEQRSISIMRIDLWKRFGGLAATILLAGVALMTTTTAANAAPATSTNVRPFIGIFHPIRSVDNGRCLQPDGGSTADVEIVQEVCNGSTAQGWLFSNLSGNDWHIVNQLSGKCVYLNQFPIVNGSPIVQTDCTTVSNETWKSTPPPPDVVTLMSRAQNRDTNFCIDRFDGRSARMFRCNGTPAQRWIVGFN